MADDPTYEAQPRNLIDTKFWQVQARIEHNLRTPLVTFELVRSQDRETWSIRSMEANAA